MLLATRLHCCVVCRGWCNVLSGPGVLVASWLHCCVSGLMNPSLLWLTSCYNSILNSSLSCCVHFLLHIHLEPRTPSLLWLRLLVLSRYNLIMNLNPRIRLAHISLVHLLLVADLTVRLEPLPLPTVPRLCSPPFTAFCGPASVAGMASTIALCSLNCPQHTRGHLHLPLPHLNTPCASSS